MLSPDDLHVWFDLPAGTPLSHPGGWKCETLQCPTCREENRARARRRQAQVAGTVGPVFAAQLDHLLPRDSRLTNDLLQASEPPKGPPGYRQHMTESRAWASFYERHPWVPRPPRRKGAAWREDRGGWERWKAHFDKLPEQARQDCITMSSLLAEQDRLLKDFQQVGPGQAARQIWRQLDALQERRAKLAEEMAARRARAARCRCCPVHTPAHPQSRPASQELSHLADTSYPYGGTKLSADGLSARHDGNGHQVAPGLDRLPAGQDGKDKSSLLLATEDLDPSAAKVLLAQERKAWEAQESTDAEKAPGGRAWLGFYGFVLTEFHAGRLTRPADCKPADVEFGLDPPWVIGDPDAGGHPIWYKAPYLVLRDGHLIPQDRPWLRKVTGNFDGWDEETWGPAESAKPQLRRKLMPLVVEIQLANPEYSAAKVQQELITERWNEELNEYRPPTVEAVRKAIQRARDRGLMHQPVLSHSYVSKRKLYTAIGPWVAGPDPDRELAEEIRKATGG